MNHKELLLQQANEVNTLLSVYIEIHNARLKQAGSFSSLLKNIFFSKSVNFKGLYEDTNKLIDAFKQKEKELREFNDTYYKSLNELEKDFFRTLIDYYEALFNTVKVLHSLTEVQYKTSQGGRNKITLNENMKLEKEYDKARNEYFSFGKELMQQYTKLAAS